MTFSTAFEPQVQPLAKEKEMAKATIGNYEKMKFISVHVCC